jgi:hypothetical protein
VLEGERGEETKSDAEGHAAAEGEKENADAVEDRANVDLGAAELGKRLIHDDCDSVVEDTLAKYDAVELGIDLYCWKMARIVTGSVALSVEPNMRHSIMLKCRDSMPRIDQIYTRTLRRRGVPANSAPPDG